MKIAKQFKDMGINYEDAVAHDATSVPANHHVYNYVWELIDDYSDKQHLYETFKKEENRVAETDVKYDFIDILYTNKNLYNELRVMWYDIVQENEGNPDVGFTTMTNDFLFKVSEQYGDEKWCTQDFLSLFKDPDFMALIQDIKKLDEKYNEICAPIKMIKETSFADAIKERYDLDADSSNIRLPLNSDLNIIMNAKKRADSHFLDMSLNFNFPGVTITTQGFDEKSERKMLTTEALEKHFNLLQNPKNKQFYISNGQGLMIHFDPDNDQYIYIPLRKKFRQKVQRKNGMHIFNIIWSRPDFYKLGHQYCSQLQESEAFLVSFNNCCYNAKLKTIYELDYRFPRLPMKRSAQNFIFDRDLTGKGGALEQVLNYCFTDEDRLIIYKYLGRALFEQGYTQHQEILMFLGKGGTGKTTFATALSKIFSKVSSMAADKMDNTNRFAFSQLPDADFIIMDEITNAQTNFVEMMKMMSNGGDSLPIEMKNQNTFNLPAEYIPLMIAIGNQLKPALYDKFAGAGVARRFCIVFLKHSILEAKVLGVDENGNEIRGAYMQEELFERNCIEWLIQQVVLHYDAQDTQLLSSEEALKRAEMAAFPEQWVIKNHLEVMRDPEHTRNVSRGDESPLIYAEDLLDLIHQKVDENMLEKTITEPHSEKFIDLLIKTLHLDDIGRDQDDDGQLTFRGLIWHTEKFLKDKRQK